MAALSSFSDQPAMAVMPTRFSITAKRPPKRLKSANFGIKISWPENDVLMLSKDGKDALRPPIFIDAPKPRI